MRVLLVDNSKPECAIFTPKLEEQLRHHAFVVRASTREAVEAHLAEAWDAIVLSGSSLNMSQTLTTSAIAKDLMVLLRCPDVPILGVCFGMQLMAVAYGGEVRRLADGRQGQYDVRADGPVATGQIAPFFHHQDEVTIVPPEFVVDAVDANSGMIVGMHARALHRYGVQYHPECSTGEGARVLQRFLTLARKHRVPIAETLTFPRRTVDVIALDVARIGMRQAARKHRLPIEVVLDVWRAFRTELRIPPLLV
jgi:GMP synthase-like glutamine amidotransferase